MWRYNLVWMGPVTPTVRSQSGEFDSSGWSAGRIDCTDTNALFRENSRSIRVPLMDSISWYKLDLFLRQLETDIEADLDDLVTMFEAITGETITFLR